MNQQKSYDKKNAASLFLVPTPIGNLEDMTFRAVRMLKEVSVIFAEDTRQTRKLCSHFDISTPLDSYHDHNKEQKGEKILSYLLEGKDIALVSDAGMPLVSDPGKEIVQLCIERAIPVVALPGANAALTALTASGLGGGAFYFYGFLPRKKKEKEEILSQLSAIKVPLIFYESPYRVKETIGHIAEKWENREIVLARELTKKFEEISRLTGKDWINHVKEWKEAVKGECCIVVEGKTDDEGVDETWWESFSILEHVHHYEEAGMTSKEAIKAAAKDRNIPKREVYSSYHNL